jgi:hypothetical protein
MVELEISGKIAIVQLVCDVKNGSMRSVLGRKEIKTAKDAESARNLAKFQAYKDVKKALNM